LPGRCVCVCFESVGCSLLGWLVGRWLLAGWCPGCCFRPEVQCGLVNVLRSTGQRVIHSDLSGSQMPKCPKCRNAERETIRQSLHTSSLPISSNKHTWSTGKADNAAHSISIRTRVSSRLVSTFVLNTCVHAAGRASLRIGLSCLRPSWLSQKSCQKRNCLCSLVTRMDNPELAEQCAEVSNWATGWPKPWGLGC
jgi:hypothetical protein